MTQKLISTLLMPVLLCACAVPRTPIELKQSTPPMGFSFATDEN